MAEYDPDIIQVYANRLYFLANVVIFTYTIVGALVGGLVGYASSPFVRGNFTNEGLQYFPLITLIVGGIMGYIIGDEKAFRLKLQAQLALCQVEIEYNTREDDEGDDDDDDEDE